MLEVIKNYLLISFYRDSPGINIFLFNTAPNLISNIMMASIKGSSIINEGSFNLRLWILIISLRLGTIFFMMETRFL